MNTCDCGRPIHIKKTGECQRCYNRSYHTAHRAKPSPFGPKFRSKPPTTACSYETAHHRLTWYRGRAKDYLCPCGKRAAEWAYNGGSPLEIKAVVDRGRHRNPSTMVWSPDVADYDVLCQRCHAGRDGHRYLEGGRLTDSLNRVAKWADLSVDELLRRIITPEPLDANDDSRLLSRSN